MFDEAIKIDPNLTVAYIGKGSNILLLSIGNSLVSLK